MYTPEAFKVDDPTLLHADMNRNPLATLISYGNSGLIATHLPVLFDETRGPHGTLLGHVSRANTHWQLTDHATESLLIFTGPDTYVTPAWYPAKQVHGRVVPTWNYSAIHAYGPVTFFDDPTRLLSIVTRLTNLHEAALPQPWQVTDAPAAFIEGQLKAIVGFEMPITRIEGKRKFNQNRSADDQSGVITGLRSLNDPTKSEAADFMESITPTKPE